VIGGISALGGLAIDVAALKPIINTVAQLGVMFGDWQISYSAATVPAGTPFLNYGAYFQGGC
jgi:cephalosporin-C deacetylase-like acetyl esterase